MSRHNGILLVEDTELDQNELQMLQLSADGLSIEDCAKEMFKSEKSVEGYRTSAFSKLKAKNITHAVAIAMRNKLIK